MANDQSTYGFSVEDADSLINIIGTRERELPEHVSRYIGVNYFYPPSSGIPAATTSGSTLTPGTATCFYASENAGSFVKGTVTALVKNMVGTAVGTNGKPVAAIPDGYGGWTVIVEDCTGTTTTTTTGGSTGTGSGLGGTGTAI